MSSSSSSGRRGRGADPPPMSFGDLLRGIAQAIPPDVRRAAQSVAGGALTETLTDSLSRASPHLTTNQLTQVRNIVADGVRGLLRGRTGRAVRSLRSAVSLAAPHERARGVWESWITAIELAGIVLGRGSGSSAPDVAAPPSMPSPSPSSRRSGDRDGHDVYGSRSRRRRDRSPGTSADPTGGLDEDEIKALKSQIKRYKVPRKWLSAVPPVVLPSLLSACESTPTCSITLEDLVNGKGHLIKDVVALVQPGHEIDPRDPEALSDPASWHVFLFKQEALRSWFDASDTPVNPMTRNAVTQAQVYPLTTRDGFSFDQ